MTSNQEQPFVEYIPYFNAIGRIDDARKQESRKTTEVMDDLTQKLKFRDHDLNILYKKNLALKQEICAHQIDTRELKEKIKKLESSIVHMEVEKGEQRTQAADREKKLKQEIDTLQTSLAQSNHIIEKLSVFRSAYTDATSDAILLERQRQANLDLVIDPQGMVDYDLHHAERLKNQLAEILNSNLDDFESSLVQLRKKRDILLDVIVDEEERENSYRLELTDLSVGFRKQVTDLLEEQKLLKEHIKALRLIRAQSLDEKYQHTMRRIADAAVRKYALLMLISQDNGTTYAPVSNIPMCYKCGEKTILCPHRHFSEIIGFPAGTTHAKFVHPAFRLKSYFTKETIEIADSDNEDEETEDENLKLPPTMLRIWRDYYDNRGARKPRFPRQFSKDRLLALIQDVYDARWALEEEGDKYGESAGAMGLISFIDFFYHFMEKRYQVSTIVLKAVHDVFSAIQVHLAESLAIDVFAQHLSREMDVVWKYFMLAKKLLSRYENIDMSSYRRFLGIMYPSRTKETYDQMELELIAYSKNRLSREMVEQHLLHMLISGIEPNYVHFYHNLKRFDYQRLGHLSCDDFDDAMEQILPQLPSKTKKQRYRLAELDCNKDQVPLSRLAHILFFTHRSLHLTIFANLSTFLDWNTLIASYGLLHMSYLSEWQAQTLLIWELGDVLSGRSTASEQNLVGGDSLLGLMRKDVGTQSNAGSNTDIPNDPLASGAPNTASTAVGDDTGEHPHDVDAFLNNANVTLMDEAAIEEEKAKLSKKVDLMRQQDKKEGIERRKSVALKRHSTLQRKSELETLGRYSDEEEEEQDLGKNPPHNVK
ncbi:hypothetical protein HK102_013525 [Quaeritorhiza haematococci]|nr:hypothetical protein HK102_013525 [Quaeritorhiza haematococci]